ncbi:hypothetical protein [Ruania halotolerans]|uniref:hypothetical protein n=1 Tax=Ruania halotolerans TaxID=2897773 RepID=UPI001E52EA08|nr:hypothetical protein [Ruania halotolerans]UFU05094.1 hypothetical protein LQF10_11485 [Ruania halotolerans]
MLTRDARRATYLRLGTGEWAATVAFTLAYLMLRDTLAPGDQIALAAALVPLLLILMQAGSYWLLARRWVGVRVMPPGVAGMYRAFRLANPIVLAPGLGVVIWGASTIGATVLIAGVWLFAVVEYLNYYVIRLAYPVAQWASLVRQRRTPQLMKDVRARGTAAGGC